MGAAAGISAGVGLLTGGAKFFEGRKQQKKAERAIANFKWQDLENPYEKLQVSTLGADLQREEMARTTATTTDALRAGGTRAIIGGIGQVQAQSNTANRQIAADLDQQQKQIDFSAAGQDVRNQEMIETRQANELAGLGQQLYAGQQTKYTGLSDMTNALGMASQMKNPFGKSTPQVQGVSSLQPQGVVPMGQSPMGQGIPTNFQF